MDQKSFDNWRDDVMQHVFIALAASTDLNCQLVFKGAQVLSRRLGDAARQSYDIDANLRDEIQVGTVTAVERRDNLQSAIQGALEDYFRSAPSVRYMIERVTLKERPSKRGHPLGWNALVANIVLRDNQSPGVKMPRLGIDISAPEQLGAHATSTLIVGGYEVIAYTDVRIAAEKLRAFLTTLPTYRNKMQKPGDAVRAKDLFDLRRILATHPIAESAFWRKVGDEFRLACESRFVDCLGIESFAEDFAVTRSTYANDKTIPETWSFDDVWEALERVVAQFAIWGLFPLSFPRTDSG